MLILLHHSSESAAGRDAEAGGQQGAVHVPTELPAPSPTGHAPPPPPGLHYNRHRHFDPTPGQWVNEDPIGYDRGDNNLTRHVSCSSAPTD